MKDCVLPFQFIFLEVILRYFVLLVLLCLVNASCLHPLYQERRPWVKPMNPWLVFGVRKKLSRCFHSSPIFNIFHQLSPIFSPGFPGFSHFCWFFPLHFSHNFCNFQGFLYYKNNPRIGWRENCHWKLRMNFMVKSSQFPVTIFPSKSQGKKPIPTAVTTLKCDLNSTQLQIFRHFSVISQGFSHLLPLFQGFSESKNRRTSSHRRWSTPSVTSLATCDVRNTSIWSRGARWGDGECEAYKAWEDVGRCWKIWERYEKMWELWENPWTKWNFLAGKFT